MSTELYLASPTALPVITTLATWFEDQGGAEVHAGRIILAQTTPIEKITLAEAPAELRKLKPAQRKAVLRATLGSLDVVEDLASALGATVINEDGERLFRGGTAKPPAKRPASPKADVTIPADMQAAFFGHYLPVLAVRRPWGIKVQKLAPLFTPEQRKQIGYARISGEDFSVGELVAKVVEPTYYTRELDQLRLTGIIKIVRVMPRDWFTTQPRPEDEQLVLGMLCALARLSAGVIYSRPGGVRLEPDSKNTAIPHVFDFETGEPVRR